MKLHVCKDSQEVAQQSHLWLEEISKNFNKFRLFVPAGSTPLGLYNIWESHRPDFLERATLVQVDDILDGPKRGHFKQFFSDHLPSYQKNFEYIEQANEGSDLAILGLGLNGHIAFHEPEIDLSFFSGCVRLSKETCDTLKLQEPTWGISYGLQAFMACKKILLMVTGKAKQKILKNLIEMRGHFPALYLSSHSDLTLIVDRAAMGNDLVVPDFLEISNKE